MRNDFLPCHCFPSKDQKWAMSLSLLVFSYLIQLYIIYIPPKHPFSSLHLPPSSSNRERLWWGFKKEAGKGSGEPTVGEEASCSSLKFALTPQPPCSTQPISSNSALCLDLRDTSGNSFLNQVFLFCHTWEAVTNNFLFQMKVCMGMNLSFHFRLNPLSLIIAPLVLVFAKTWEFYNHNSSKSYNNYSVITTLSLRFLLLSMEWKKCFLSVTKISEP